MTIRSNAAMFRQIQTLFNVGTIGDLTDAQLLERFKTLDREAAEHAFAALVERHGPMVLRVCQSLLKNPQDAEDACQATFFILRGKLDLSGYETPLAPWLYRVARRVAARARASARSEDASTSAAYCRGKAEGLSTLTTILRIFSCCSTPEIEPAARRYRAAVLVCDMEGLLTSGPRGSWAGQSARLKVAWREPVSYCEVV